MARSNPGVGPLKPHIRKVRTGIWVRVFRDQAGQRFSTQDVTWMTANSVDAREASIWCTNRNARIVASRGFWNCRSVLPNG